MSTQIEFLKKLLARQTAEFGPDAQVVQHLKWQLASNERQARCRETGELPRENPVTL